MWHAIQVVVAMAAIAFFAWLLLGSRTSTSDDAVIDPADARQMGTLLGMMGRSVEDAAVAQFALRRFEERHGRKATIKDMGIVAGMMRSGR